MLLSYTASPNTAVLTTTQLLLLPRLTPRWRHASLLTCQTSQSGCQGTTWSSTWTRLRSCCFREEGGGPSITAGNTVMVTAGTLRSLCVTPEDELSLSANIAAEALLCTPVAHREDLPLLYCTRTSCLDDCSSLLTRAPSVWT